MEQLVLEHMSIPRLTTAALRAGEFDSGTEALRPAPGGDLRRLAPGMTPQRGWAAALRPSGS